MVEDSRLEDRQLAAPKEILDLVERFENSHESYNDVHYIARLKSEGNRDNEGRLRSWLERTCEP
jgi:hypothetical protein